MAALCSITVLSSWAETESAEPDPSPSPSPVSEALPPVAQASPEPTPEPSPEPSSVSHYHPLIGHNLFTTTYVLPAGVWSAGNYAIVRGMSDFWSVGFSPWIYGNYNMAHVNFRAGQELGGGVRTSFEANYFETFGVRWAQYKQKSVFLRNTWTVPLGQGVFLHPGFGYQYFWEDESPFSLRPFPFNHDRYTLSFGALSEWRFSNSWSMFLEAGILGLNHRRVFKHVGLSVTKHWKNSYLQIGMSYSWRRKGEKPNPYDPTDPDCQVISNKGTGDCALYRVDVLDPGFYHNYIKYRQWLLHPEIQYQIFF